MSEYAKIPLLQAEDALQDLNEYVVCLDRILSRIGAGEAGADILLDYVVDRNVLRRLAELRTVLGDSLKEQVGEDRVDEIAEGSYQCAPRGSRPA